MHGIYRPSIQNIGLADRPVEQGEARRGAAGGRTILGGLAAAVRRVADAGARWRARRAARADLAALPDWALADIGLERADIPRVADAIAAKLRDAGPGGRPPKIKLQSLAQDGPLTGHVRVISGGSPGLAGCG